MAGGVFISYRREDSAGYAGRIRDRLIQKFSSAQVFMDVDNIEPGLDFVEILGERVGDCDVLLAVIGKNWMNCRDAEGNRRLDDANDFVRIEIESALGRNVRVIPTLVDGATMPRGDDLPDGLKPLARRNAVEISHTRFDSDAERLVRALTQIEEARKQREADEAARHAAAQEVRKAAEAEAELAARLAEEARERREAEAAALLAKTEEERRAREAAAPAQALRIEEARERREAEAAALLAKTQEERRAGQAAAATQAMRIEEARERREAEEATRLAKAEEDRRSAEVEEAVRELVQVEDARPKREAEEAAQRSSEEQKRRVSEVEMAILRFVHPENWRAQAQGEVERQTRAAEETTHFAQRKEAVGIAEVEATAVALEASVAEAPYSPPSWRMISRRIFSTDSRLLLMLAIAVGILASIIVFGTNWGRNLDPADSDPRVTECDRLAADPHDLNRPSGVVGVPYEYIYMKDATEACQAAVDKFPDQPRMNYELGRVLYENSSLNSKIYAWAAKFFQISANMNYAAAQYAFGKLFAEGEGVTKDEITALLWFRKAAEQEYAPAQAHIGYMYALGLGGLSKNSTLALDWYLKAAEQGLDVAQYDAGLSYENGDGVQKNVTQAREWYQKAAAQGYEDAKAALKRLDAK
jgi:TPR repeat protein